MISYDELDQLRADRAAGMSATARLLQMKLDALRENDHRSFDVRVAGPAALLVAKAHKIDERQGTNRLTDKDALDVLRLLRGTETYELATRFAKLFADHRSERAAKTSRDSLETLFAKRTSVGTQMAVRSAGVLADAAIIAASCEALVGDLLCRARVATRHRSGLRLRGPA